MPHPRGMLNKNTQDCENSACVYSFSRTGKSPRWRSVVGQHSGPSRGRVRPADRPTGIVAAKYDARGGGGGGGGGAHRYRGGPHPRYVLRYEVWGSKSPYNPGNIRGSDAEWLPKYLANEFAAATCCR